MGLQVLFAASSLLGLLAEVGLFVVLIVRRQYKIFPFFTLYIAFNLLYDVGTGALLVLFPVLVARSIAFGLLPLGYLLALGVLLEITWNVLRPVHASLPQGSIRLFGGS